MSRSVKLPDPLYRALLEEAKSRGMTLVGWIAAHLSHARGETGSVHQAALASPEGERTLADLFAGRIGVVDSGGRERLSEDCGEKFTDYLEEKRRAGRL